MVRCTGVRHWPLYLRGQRTYWLSLFLFFFFISAAALSWTLLSSTDRSFGSLLSPLRWPAFLRLLSSSGYIYDGLLFSFSDVRVVSLTCLMLTPFLITLMQFVVWVLPAFKYFDWYPGFEKTSKQSSRFSLNTIFISRYGNLSSPTGSSFSKSSSFWWSA